MEYETAVNGCDISHQDSGSGINAELGWNCWCVIFWMPCVTSNAGISTPKAAAAFEQSDLAAPTATNPLAVELDNTDSKADMEMDRYARMAMKHWQEHLPEMHQELVETGQLEH